MMAFCEPSCDPRTPSARYLILFTLILEKPTSITLPNHVIVGMPYFPHKPTINWTSYVTQSYSSLPQPLPRRSRSRPVISSQLGLRAASFARSTTNPTCSFTAKAICYVPVMFIYPTVLCCYLCCKPEPYIKRAAPT